MQIGLCTIPHVYNQIKIYYYERVLKPVVFSWWMDVCVFVRRISVRIVCVCVFSLSIAIRWPLPPLFFCSLIRLTWSAHFGEVLTKNVYRKCLVLVRAHDSNNSLLFLITRSSSKPIVIPSIQFRFLPLLFPISSAHAFRFIGCCARWTICMPSISVYTVDARKTQSRKQSKRILSIAIRIYQCKI